MKAPETINVEHNHRRFVHRKLLYFDPNFADIFPIIQTKGVSAGVDNGAAANRGHFY